VEKALGLPPDSWAPRDNTFFDAWDPGNKEHNFGEGFVLRARVSPKTKNKGAVKLKTDLTEKKRPVPPDYALPKGIEVEPEVNGDGEVVWQATDKDKDKHDKKKIRKAAEGKTPLADVLTPAQMEFFKQEAPIGAELRVAPLGTVSTKVWKARLHPFPAVSVEEWDLPGRSLLEFSVNAPLAKKDEVLKQLKRAVTDRGLTVEPVQRMKTGAYMDAAATAHAATLKAAGK
jgi:hypothetical protein